MDSSHATKSCVLVLLVALLCAERAQGLKCYECRPVPLETSCNITTCSYPDGFCVTQETEIIVDSQRRKVKTSNCLPYCPTDQENNTLTTSCCKEDLCNAAAPTGGGSTWTLAGVLLSCLGSVLLQTLL